MVKLTACRFEALNAALINIGNREGVRITTETDSIRLNDDSKTEFGRHITFNVSWGGHGSVPAEYASEFSKKLATAASIAESLNELDMYVDYSNDEPLDNCERLIEDIEYALVHMDLTDKDIRNFVGNYFALA